MPIVELEVRRRSGPVVHRSRRRSARTTSAGVPVAHVLAGRSTKSARPGRPRRRPRRHAHRAQPGRAWDARTRRDPLLSDPRSRFAAASGGHATKAARACLGRRTAARAEAPASRRRSSLCAPVRASARWTNLSSGRPEAPEPDGRSLHGCGRLRQCAPHARSGRGSAPRRCRRQTPAFRGRKRQSGRGRVARSKIVRSGRVVGVGGDDRMQADCDSAASGSRLTAPSPRRASAGRSR